VGCSVGGSVPRGRDRIDEDADADAETRVTIFSGAAAVRIAGQTRGCVPWTPVVDTNRDCARSSMSSVRPISCPTLPLPPSASVPSSWHPPLFQSQACVSWLRPWSWLGPRNALGPCAGTAAPVFRGLAAPVLGAKHQPFCTRRGSIQHSSPVPSCIPVPTPLILTTIS
jgi:hypothetical protein